MAGKWWSRAGTQPSRSYALPEAAFLRSVVLSERRDGPEPREEGLTFPPFEEGEALSL